MTEGSDCITRKRQFATEDAAVTSRADNLRRGSPMSAYRCSFCGCWHIGNRRSSNSKGRTRR